MNMWKRIVVAAVMSWAYSVTLGLLFAVAALEMRTPRRRPVATGCRSGCSDQVAAMVAIAIAPVAYWSERTGARNLRLYGPILWTALADYIIFVFPKVGYYGRYGLLFLAVLGSVALGFIPAK